MNKNSKIIVSIIGISIVLLALLGITYAYYLTRIEGNTNSNSISVTTADLRLVYGDGNGIITKNDIMPGTTIGEKTFTVKNTGKTRIDDYAVTLEYAFIENIVPSIFERPNDFEITLTCNYTKKDGTTGSCNGYTGKFNNENMILTTSAIESEETHSYSLVIYYANPNEDQSNDMGKNLNLKVDIFRASETTDLEGEVSGVNEAYSIRLNSEPKMSTIIKKDEDTYIYKFKGVPLGTHTLTVVNNEVEDIASHKLVVQSGEIPTTGTKEITYEENGDTITKIVPSITIKDDKRVANITTEVNTTNKTVSTTGSGISSFNPYENNKTTLAYNIINNAILGQTGTEFSVIPKTKPAEVQSGSEERTLSLTTDKLGTSYYYRGAVNDNYVLFNDMCFRIVRILGDGSIKLIFAGDVTAGASNCNETGAITGLLKDTNGEDLKVVYGYDGNYRADYENNSYGKEENNIGLEEIIKNWYTSKFTSDILKAKIKTDKWCLGGNENIGYDRNGNKYIGQELENLNYSYYYAAYNRVYSTEISSLICEEEDYVESNYGTLTVDEIMLAGGTSDINLTYYLYTNAQEKYWWTLSRASYSDDHGYVFYMNNRGNLYSDYVVTGLSGVRPSVTLLSGTTITGGIGTIERPYIIGNV